MVGLRKFVFALVIASYRSRFRRRDQASHFPSLVSLLVSQKSWYIRFKNGKGYCYVYDTCKDELNPIEPEPTQASERYSPTKEPVVEPRNGAIENAAIGMPCSLDFQRSVNVPRFRVIGALKAMPSIVRQTKRV